MHISKEPRGEIYQYGFLSRKAARILSELSSGAKLNNESRRIIKLAKSFMDLVQNGEALVSGDRDMFAPSEEGLKAFQYGLKALSVMERLQLINKLDNRTDLIRELSNIKETLAEILNGLNGKISKDRIITVAKFFRLIANSLSEESRRKIYQKVASL